MKTLIFFALLASAGAVFSAVSTEVRVTGLEHRVTKVEKRVTRIERGGAAAPARVFSKKKGQPEDPIAVYLLRKTQVIGKEKMGLILYLEFENTAHIRYYAFNGNLVFTDENGAGIWNTAYAYSEPLMPGSRAKASVVLPSTQTREYLKFIRAKKIRVKLEKQEVYGPP